VRGKRFEERRASRLLLTAKPVYETAYQSLRSMAPTKNQASYIRPEQFHLAAQLQHITSLTADAYAISKWFLNRLEDFRAYPSAILS
jgi:hypothetical protein